MNCFWLLKVGFVEGIFEEIESKNKKKIRDCLLIS